MTTILQNGFTKLVLPTRNGFHFIAIKSILYLDAQGNYTQFYLENGKTVIVSKTLGYYEKILESHFFFRLSRSHMVNLRHIQEYTHFKSPIIKITNGQELNLSERKKTQFRRMILSGIVA